MANVIHVRHDWSEGIDWPQNSCSTMCGMRSKGKFGFPTTDRMNESWCMVCIRALYHSIEVDLPKLEELQSDTEGGVRVFQTIIWYQNLYAAIEPTVLRWKARDQARRERERAARQSRM